MPHPLRWSWRGYRYLDKCRPSQVPATSRSGAREPQDRLRIEVRAEKIMKKERKKKRKKKKETKEKRKKSSGR